MLFAIYVYRRWFARVQEEARQAAYAAR
jgi:hypothetical protein